MRDIEQRIKEKVEAVGVPLREWDVSINRGIVTGFNKAFVITSAKKDELIAADPRSAEIIRPILRGRDIKRYSFQFADLYLICTFPSRNYDIEVFPAIKNHLLSFGYERLEQSGKSYFVNGERISARKKTNNKWFEIQDSINYWDEFNKQKIIYPNMTKYLPFFLDNSFMTNQKCFIITGKYLGYLTAFFNSSLFKFCFKDNFPELLGGTRELSKVFFDKIPVKMVDDLIESTFLSLVDQIQLRKLNNMETHNLEDQVDNLIFDIYELSTDDRKTIGYIEIK